MLQTNPCQFVELPKKQRYESSYYSADQLKNLFDAIRDDPIYPLVKITALYGLRRSEVLGLKWDSVDFTAGRLTIKHTVSKVTTTVCKDKTKNSSSHRSFPLSPEAREIFIQAKAEEQNNRLLCGADYEENEFIFNASPYTPDELEKPPHNDELPAPSKTCVYLDYRMDIRGGRGVFEELEPERNWDGGRIEFGILIKPVSE